MPLYNPVPATTGAEQVFSLLAMLDDPEAVKRRMRELLEQEAKVNAAIALAGRAEEIPALHAKASDDAARAASVLATAKAQAAEIVRDAIQQRDEALAAAAKAREEVIASKANIIAEETRLNAERRAHETKAKQREKNIGEALKEAAQVRAEADAAKLEWETKVRRLKEAGVA